MAAWTQTVGGALERHMWWCTAAVSDGGVVASGKLGHHLSVARATFLCV